MTEESVFEPPFTHKAGYIWAKAGPIMDDAGDQIHVSRMRGWGRLTGKGHGGLGMDPAEAAVMQDAIGAKIAKILTEHWND